MIFGKWVDIFSKMGHQINDENIVAKRIAFSNIIYVALPIVYFIFIVIDFKSYVKSFGNQRFDQYIVPIEIALCLFCLGLNQLKYTTSSRLLFILSWPVLMHILPVYLLNTPSDYFIAYPLGIIFHSVLIHLMFSFKKEASLFWVLIIINFILMLFACELLVFFASSENVVLQFKNDWYYFLDIFLYWLLFNMVTFYILFTIEKYISNLNSSNKLIKEQKEELDILIENLDKMVSIKTEKLALQNAKLKEYAFYNAHVIRGPFCRVQGLMQLLELLDENEIEELQIKSRLKESIVELETRINEIQTIVHEDSDS